MMGIAADMTSQNFTRKVVIYSVQWPSDHNRTKSIKTLATDCTIFVLAVNANFEPLTKMR